MEIGVIKYEELNRLFHTELADMMNSCFQKASVMLDILVDAATLEKICDKQLAHMARINELYHSICEVCPQAVETRKTMFEFATNVLLDSEAAGVIRKDMISAHETLL